MTVYLIMSMIILSWNVNGLRDVNKMNTVISVIKETHAKITFLQETFWDDNFIETYKHLWNGKIYYNNCNNEKRKGVAILFSSDFPYNIKFVKSDTNGRLLKVNFDIDEETYSCLNVYAPNSPTERIDFYEEMLTYICGDRIIASGDFNELQDSFLDKNVNVQTFNAKSSKRLCDIINDNNLCDIWRYRNPDKREFTRKQIVNNVCKQTRIDFSLISRSLIPFATHAYIKYTSLSDHAINVVKFDFSKVERGPGMWIFNNQLLTDSVFTKSINELISENLSCSLYNSEPLVWWDNLKYKIKKCCIYFSCKKKKAEKSDYYRLQNKLRVEYNKLAVNPLRDLSYIHDLEQQLEVYEKMKCQAAVLRSKAQWALESDRNTAFFLNLEKTKQESNTIKELITDKGVTTKTEDIN